MSARTTIYAGGVRRFAGEFALAHACQPENSRGDADVEDCSSAATQLPGERHLPTCLRHEDRVSTDILADKRHEVVGKRDKRI
jgi:hypothetical protein